MCFHPLLVPHAGRVVHGIDGLALSSAPELLAAEPNDVF